VALARFMPLGACSWYSVNEGVDSPEALLARATACGYPALALTDVNSLAGAVEFVQAAKRLPGARPILGARLRAGGQKALALIAEPAGWRSLCRILSRIHGPGSAALDRLLAENAEGLHLLLDNPFALKPPLVEAFRGRLWAELVRPGSSEAQERVLTLGPQAVPPDRLLALAEGADPVTCAAICHRAGQHDETVKLLAGRSEPRALFFRALAEHARGRPAEARRALEQAAAALEAPGPGNATLPLGRRLAWDERLELELLKREADAQLKR
jgi:hypothetical protein